MKFQEGILKELSQGYKHYNSHAGFILGILVWRGGENSLRKP